jgi:hypothetical protein
MGDIPEMGQWRRGVQKGLWRRKVITIERDRKKWKHSRKGHRRKGDYGRGREKVDER